MNEIPEGKQTVTGEGRDLLSAIESAAQALGVEAAKVGYKLDMAHFRSQSGGMVAKQTVRVIGWVDESDLIVGLATLERVLVRLGVPVELGAAVGAAQRLFAKDS